MSWSGGWCSSRYLHNCHLSSGLWLSYILSSHQERTQLRLATSYLPWCHLRAHYRKSIENFLIWDPSLIIWDPSLIDKTEHTMGGDRAWASCIHLAPDCLYLDWRWYIFLFCEDGTICDIGTGRLRVWETVAFLPLCYSSIIVASNLPNFAQITARSLLFCWLLTFFSIYTIGQKCTENLQRVENRNAYLLWGVLLNTWSKKCQVLSPEDSNMQKVLPIQF